MMKSGLGEGFTYHNPRSSIIDVGWASDAVGQSRHLNANSTGTELTIINEPPVRCYSKNVLQSATRSDDNYDAKCSTEVAQSTHSKVPKLCASLGTCQGAEEGDRTVREVVEGRRTRCIVDGAEEGEEVTLVE
jgi:hypothetical protein